MSDKSELSSLDLGQSATEGTVVEGAEAHEIAANAFGIPLDEAKRAHQNALDYSADIAVPRVPIEAE